MTKEQFEADVLSAEKSLYYLARSILPNDEDCADALQNAILLAYRRLDTLKEEKYFKTWLTRILLNECYRLLKSSKNQVSYEEYMERHALEPQAPETAAEDSGLFTELARLETQYKIPLILYYVEGYSSKEIAKMLKTTDGSIRTRLYRGRKLLREKLKGVEGYESYTMA